MQLAYSKETSHLKESSVTQLTANTVTAAPVFSPTRNTVAPSGEMFAMLINLSGRRRFTSQRLVLFAVLASLGHENALQTARDALKLFTEAHNALVKGSNQVPGIFSPRLHDAYFGAEAGDRHIREFISVAERCLDALHSGSRRAPVLLGELIAAGTPILAVLNHLTQVYEELSKEHATNAYKQLRGIMNDIDSIAKQARMVSFNARIVAARAGPAGKEFSVVASVLSDITGEIDGLVNQALSKAAA